MKKLTKFHLEVKPGAAKPPATFGLTLSCGLSLCAIAHLALVLLPANAATTNGAKIVAHKVHRRTGELSAALQQQADSQLLNYTSAATGQVATSTLPSYRSSVATTISTTSINDEQATTSLPDIIIDSIEDELGGAKISASNEGATSTSSGAGNRHRYEQPSSSVAPIIDATMVAEQQLDSIQPAKLEPRNQVESGPEQQAQDPAIIDHRTSSSSNHNIQTFEHSSTQTPPVSTTLASPASTTMAYGVQQQATANMMSAPSQMAPQWTSSASGQPAQSNRQASTSQQQMYYSQPQQTGAGQNQFGSMMSGSNQVATSVQYPTSINSIISEQQQQQQQPAQAQMQYHATTINGQPASLVYVNQPQAAASAASNGMALSLPLGQSQGQLVGIVQNGRRVSLSNWLRGIGSMLANIFNRRDHGNSIQQAMLASNQNGVIIQAPQGQTQQQPQTVGAPTTTGANWIQLGPNAPHWLTQAQSAIQQLQQGSNRLTTFIQTAPSALTSSLASSGQLVQSPTMAYQQQAGGDLQASGSSNSYVSIQSPTGVSLATNQPYQSGPIIVAAHQPQQGPTPTQQQSQQISRQQQVVSGGMQSSSQVAEQPGAAKQQQQPSGQHNQARFGRSSSSHSGISGQQTNGNLPLTHYSQYSTSSD